MEKHIAQYSLKAKIWANDIDGVGAACGKLTWTNTVRYRRQPNGAGLVTTLNAYCNAGTANSVHSNHAKRHICGAVRN